VAAPGWAGREHCPREKIRPENDTNGPGKMSDPRDRVVRRAVDITVLSDNAFELDLLGNTFVRFIRAFDAIQPFAALGREQLRYFIYAARSGG
jgi:hypothetical protein